jgi:heat shock protein HslJ
MRQPGLMLAAFAAFAALVVAACAGPAAGVSAAPPSLGGTRWVGLGDEKADRASLPRLEFTREGRVVGFTGCNLLNGSYTLEGDRIDVMAATTKRACLGPGGEAEAKLLEVLGDRPRVTLGARTLVLTGSKGATFELRQVAPSN